MYTAMLIGISNWDLLDFDYVQNVYELEKTMGIWMVGYQFWKKSYLFDFSINNRSRGFFLSVKPQLLQI